MFCPDTVYDQYGGTFYGAKIYLCHTTRTTLSTIFADNYSGNTPVLVLSQSSLTLNWTENAWNQIGLDTSFNYNGVDNLLIEIRWDSANGGLITGATYPGSGVLLGSSVGATSGSLSSYRNVFRLTYSTTDWDSGYQNLGGGWRRLSWFGDYIPMGGAGWIWHNKHGFFYVPPSSTPQSVFFYAQDMGWLWTSSTTYPYLYRFSDGAWLWYNGATGPRWFLNMNTSNWESH